MKKMLKKIIIFVILFILVIVAWNLLFGKKDLSTASLTSSSSGTSALLNADENTVADNFLNTLLNLDSITLDGSLFSDERFSSLVDYTVELAPQPRGRANPFLPASASSAPVVTTTTSTTSTSSSTSSVSTSSAASVGN